MICVFPGNATDFSTNGLVVLDGLCTRAEITEELNGEYGLDLEIRADEAGRINDIMPGMVVRAPSPTRPSIELRNIVTHKVYKATKDTPMRSNASYVNGKQLRTIKKNQKIIYIRTSGNGVWYKCTTMAGASGWVVGADFTYVGEEASDTDGYQVVPDQAADQLFEIGTVSRTLEGVEIHADHIFYRLAGNYVRSLELKKATGISALAALLDACMEPHDFEGQSDVTATATIAASRRNPVDVMLAEDGFRQYDGQLLRDNFNIYFMRGVGENRGALISYRKNITGMTVDVDMSDVVTHVVPVGYWRSGTPMYLTPDPMVASPHAGDYPFKRILELDCRDVKVGDDYADSDAVRAELLARANDQFDVGIDMPAVTVDVDYVHAPSAVTDAMRCIYLGDTVTFRHDAYGLDMPLQVTGYIWDALNRRYTALTLSSKNPATAGLKINKNLIPQNAIAGRMITPQSIPAAALSPEAAEAVVASTQPPAPVQNALYLHTDPESGQLVLQRYEGDEWRTVSAGGIFSPAPDDGTPHTTVDSTGGFIPNLTSPQASPRYSGPAQIYVNSATDTDGVTYFETLYDAIEVLRGRQLDGDVTITVSEFYNDFNAIDITGLYGSGSLAIDGGSVVGGVDSRMVVYNAVRVANCSLPVTLNSLRAKHSATPLNITACTFVLVNDCVFETTASVEVVGVRRGSTVRLTGTTMAAGNFSVRAYDGSRVTLNNCTGTANICSEASMISGYGTMPSASAGSVTTTAYQNGYVSGTGGMTVSRGSGAGTIPSVPATGDIETLYPKETAWHQDIWCEPNQVGFFRQGYTGYGQITGCMWFDMSSLAGLSVAGAKLRLTRKAGVGMTDAVSVRILALGPNCKKRGDTMVRGTVYGTIGSILPGETKTFTLPASAVEHMISGAIGGICVFATDAAKASGYLWSKNYAQFMGTGGTDATKPMLTVQL